MATITTITSAGYQAALNNTPNANGYRVEIKYADVYVGKTKKGRFETKGVRISNQQLRVRATITSSGESYSYTEVRLIDGISGVEFAIIKDDKGGVLDFVSADKKSTFTTTIAMSTLPNDRVTIVQDDGNSVALAELDAHKNDENAHKSLFDKKMDKTDFNSAISNKADKTTTLTAGNGLTGGGTLGENRTLTLGTPSSITATSTNSVSATSHSHAIDKASTTTAGIVKLNNTLTSTATNEALTALQGKNLAEQIASAVSGSLNLKGLLVAQNLNDLHSEANYGVWQNSSNGNATTEKNYPPTNKAGTLLVLPSAYKGQQVYFPYDDKGIYIRDTRSNAATPTWGDWYKLAAPENTLNSTSTIAPLSAAMGKKLNDEKLGNSGTQTLNGNLHIIRNAWEKLRFVHNNGSYWRFETHPDGGDSNSSMRFNYVFMGADNTEKSRIAFPESVGTSTVAYQGWVAEQLSAAKPNNFSGIDLDSATAPQFFINAKTGYVAAAGGEHAGLILGYQNDCSQIIAAGGNLWVRGSDHNPISDPSHWSAWKRILDENNGVMLSGDQTISGMKTFANHIHTRAEIHAGGVITNSYRNDWVGYQAKQPTEGKNGFFDVLVNNVARGGMQVTAEGGGKYATKLLVTPSGTTNTDRRVVGMAVMDTGVHTQAYGWLHEYFATKAEMNTKSTVAVLTGKIAHGGTIPLPAGFSQAQCKWMVSMHNDNPTSQTWDIQESGAYNHYNATVWTDANRVVHCRVYKHGHSVSASGWQNAEANYMIIGVK